MLTLAKVLMTMTAYVIVTMYAEKHWTIITGRAFRHVHRQMITGAVFVIALILQVRRVHVQEKSARAAQGAYVFEFDILWKPHCQGMGKIELLSTWIMAVPYYNPYYSLYTRNIVGTLVPFVLLLMLHLIGLLATRGLLTNKLAHAFASQISVSTCAAPTAHVQMRATQHI
jgi:hypothetical protein